MMLSTSFVTHGLTEASVYSSQFKWKIPDYSFVTSNISTIDSSKFPNKYEKIQFYLKFSFVEENKAAKQKSPAEEKTEESVFLYINAESNNNEQDYFLEGNVYLIDKDGTKYTDQEWSCKYKSLPKNGSKLLISIKKQFLDENKETYLPDNCLTILFKYSIIEKIIKSVVHKPIDSSESNDFINGLEKLYKDREYTDVTFTVDNKQTNAHKVILCARSPVFFGMFNHNMIENSTNQVEIKDIKYEVFEELLRFIYTGVVENLEKHMYDLLVAADIYSLDSLKLISEKALAYNLGPENIVKICSLAFMYNAKYLQQCIIQYIIVNNMFEENKEAFKTIYENHPQLVESVYNHLTGNAKTNIDPEVVNFITKAPAKFTFITD